MSYKSKKEYPWEVKDTNFLFDREYRSTTFNGVEFSLENSETNETAKLWVSPTLTLKVLNNSSIADDCANRLNNAMRDQASKGGNQLPQELTDKLAEEAKKSGQQELVGKWEVGDWNNNVVDEGSEISIGFQSSYHPNGATSGYFIDEKCYFDESEFGEYFANEVNTNPTGKLATMVQENIVEPAEVDEEPNK